MEMNHRYKPKKECNSKWFKTKNIQKKKKKKICKDKQFLLGKFMTFGKVLFRNYGLPLFLKKKNGFSGVYMKKYLL